MNNKIKEYQHKGWKALTMLFAMSLAFAGSAALTACSSDDDPFFTVSEDDSPRILNTDLADQRFNRLNPLTIEIKVTPIKYTTVTWFLDDQQIYEGNVLNQLMPVGDHVLKIVATTTKGKSTSRTIKLTVLPAEDDPAPGNDIYERLVKPGSKATLHGDRMSIVKKVIIGGQLADATYNAKEDCVEYTVPNLPDGIYDLELADETGYVYGAGKIELSSDPQYPVAPETTIWEGEFNVTWSTAFDGLKDTILNYVSAGKILRVYVEGNGQGCAATSWWRNILTGVSEDDVPGGRGDVMISGEQVLEYTLTDLSIQLLTEQNGMLVVGNGFTVKKITVQ